MTTTTWVIAAVSVTTATDRLVGVARELESDVIPEESLVVAWESIDDDEESVLDGEELSMRGLVVERLALVAEGLLVVAEGTSVVPEELRVDGFGLVVEESVVCDKELVTKGLVLV